MITEEKINGMVFVAQTTYYVYKSDEDRREDKYTFVTSNPVAFEVNREEARKNERMNSNNQFVVMV